MLSALLLIAIEQQCLKPEHVLKVWAVLLHTEDTMLSTAPIQTGILGLIKAQGLFYRHSYYACFKSQQNIQRIHFNFKH